MWHGAFLLWTDQFGFTSALRGMNHFTAKSVHHHSGALIPWWKCFYLDGAWSLPRWPPPPSTVHQLFKEHKNDATPTPQPPLTSSPPNWTHLEELSDTLFFLLFVTGQYTRVRIRIILGGGTRLLKDNLWLISLILHWEEPINLTLKNNVLLMSRE